MSVIEGIKVSKGYLVINTDGKEYRFKVRELSSILERATDEEIEDYEVSPSGYGIHWRKLDEDISIPALLGKRVI